LNKKIIFGLLGVCVGISLLAVSCFIGSRSGICDVVIVGGTVYDGSGSPGRSADIGIREGTIVKVGRIGRVKGDARVIDARGQAVVPGFIDMHTHCDMDIGNPETRANLNYLTQGVTTVVTGNCGTGTYQFSELRRTLESGGIGTNLIHLAGLGPIRAAVLGTGDRQPSSDEIEKMKGLLLQALNEGAWGLSTGLMYIPDRYAKTEEIVALNEVVAEEGGVFSPHQRNEEDFLIDSVREVLRIATESGVRTNIAHFKCAGKFNWGKLGQAVTLINEARAAGLKVTADLYPYDKAAIMPLWAVFNVPKESRELYALSIQSPDADSSSNEGLALRKAYAKQLAEALGDPALRARIRDWTYRGDPDKVNWLVVEGWHNITIVNAKKNAALAGELICDLASQTGRDGFDIAADLLMEEPEDIVISVCAMSEEEIRHALGQEWTMISSDGSAVRFNVGNVHPRAYGSFARFFAKYVRDEKAVSFEKGIRMTSGLPAATIGLTDRGLIKEGFQADIVVFNPSTIQDQATYLAPHQYSTGISYVLVNGQVAVEGGKYTGALAGKILLRPAKSASPPISN
jgi:N-acyl-D-aspartate/D-glutamate deacylase